jgi:hypothetical protein
MRIDKERWSHGVSLGIKVIADSKIRKLVAGLRGVAFRSKANRKLRTALFAALYRMPTELNPVPLSGAEIRLS